MLQLTCIALASSSSCQTWPAGEVPAEGPCTRITAGAFATLSVNADAMWLIFKDEKDSPVGHGLRHSLPTAPLLQSGGCFHVPLTLPQPYLLASVSKETFYSLIESVACLLATVYIGRCVTFNHAEAYRWEHFRQRRQCFRI